MKRSCVFVLAFILLAVGSSYGSVTPKEAEGFVGTVTGTVKSTQADGLAFSLTVSKAVADSKSAARDPEAIIGKILSLGTRMPRKDGKPMPSDDDVAYIKSLKVGDVIKIKVFAVRGAPAILRMQAPGVAASSQPATKPTQN